MVARRSTECCLYVAHVHVLVRQLFSQAPEPGMTKEAALARIAELEARNAHLVKLGQVIFTLFHPMHHPVLRFL